MSDVTNFTEEDLVRKIAGLLATAESYAEQGNDEAAQSYVQKAHALQQKYSIDQAMIAERTGKQTQKIISKHIRMPGKWGKQKVNLAHVIAHTSHCTGYYKTTHHDDDGFWMDTKDYLYVVFGFEKDVEHVEFLINSLAHQMDLALEVAKTDKSRYEHGRSFNASFMLGYTSSIGHRLREAARQAQTTVAGESQALGEKIGSVSLVLASKKQQVEQEMRAQVGGLRKGASSYATSGSGWSAGKEAGRRATIARGDVGGGSRGSLGR